MASENTRGRLAFADGTVGLGAVWRSAEPYMRARKNDIHVPISYDYARRLLKEYDEADVTVVSLAIILHDIGWYSIDEERIVREAFGPDMMNCDLRILHEKEGVHLARPLLEELSYSSGVIKEVCAIIDGHDTRTEALSLNDMLVKDADKLWRFTPAGIAVASSWFKRTPTQYMKRLEEKVCPTLFLDASMQWAERELAASRQLLQADSL